MYRNTIRVAALVGIVLLGSWTGPALGACSVYGEYLAFASNSDGITLEGEIELVGQAYLEGAYTKTGEYGNFGSSWFQADLYNARVRGIAASHGEEHGNNNCSSGVGRVDDLGLTDDLTFHIPAGTYPEGVTARMSGHARGVIWSQVGAAAAGKYWVALGPEVFEMPIVVSLNTKADTVQVNDDFEIAVQLVAPGTTLSAPQDLVHTVSIWLHRCRAGSDEVNILGVNVVGDAMVDFGEGVWVDDLTVSPSVPWTSESGHFLANTSPAPPEVAGLVLGQNHPNPFNPSTAIAFRLPEDQQVSLRVYDLSGRLVRNLIAAETLHAGPHEAVWWGRDDSGRRVASGTYVYRLEAGAFSRTKRMVLVK